MKPPPKSKPGRMVACPTCKGESMYGPGNPFRPFCSERCQSVDFGAWASESYRVQAKPTSVDADADEAGPAE